MARRREAATADVDPAGRGWAHVDEGPDGLVFAEWCPRRDAAVFAPCGAAAQHVWWDPVRRRYIREYMRAVEAASHPVHPSSGHGA